MASTRVFLLVATMACLALAAAKEQPECGHQAYDAQCLFNLCCSEAGLCGSGEEACGAGCQSGPCHEELRSSAAGAPECGKQAFYADCWPRSQCCSAEGMCGTGDEFCGQGCQGGACYSSPFNLD